MTTVQKQRAAAPLPVYVIFGSETLFSRRALEAVTTEVLGDDRDQMALAEFDGSSALLAEVLDECRTASLLAPRRLIRVLDADDFIKEHREALEKYLQSPAPTGTLVLACKSFPKSTRLYKLVDRIGRNIECEPPKSFELPNWVISHARAEYGCKVDAAAARRLVDLAGPSLAQLDMELAKLATFVLPRTTLGLADVEELVGASRIEKVFGITDCVARRDAQGALALWDQVLASDRDAPFRAVAGLAYGFRKLAEAKRLVEQGLSIDEARTRTGIWTRSDSLTAQLRSFSLTQWQDHLVTLLRIDVGTKTGLGTVQAAVERFILELCAAP